MSKEYPLKARVIEEKIDLYSDTRLESAIKKEIEVGEIISLGKTLKKNGKQWVEAMTGDEKGFVLGNSMVFYIKKVKLNQNNVNVYQKPSLEAEIKEQYSKNAIFFMTDLVKKDGKEWVKVHDLSNKTGFIPGDTRIEHIASLPDMKADLGGWGFGLIALGVISNLIPDFLSAHWGILMIIFGAIILAVRKRIMYIVLGLVLFIVGIMNIIPGNSGWTVFGFLQLYWGFQEIQKFWKYKKIEEKGENEEDNNILLNIEQDKAEIEPSLPEPEEVEKKDIVSKEKSRVEVLEGVWTCPACGVRSRADSEICDECGQPVILD